MTARQRTEHEGFCYKTHSWTTYQTSDDEAESECAECMVRPYNDEAYEICDRASPLQRAVAYGYLIQVRSENPNWGPGQIVYEIVNMYDREGRK